MALKLLQPSLRPLGQFDLKDDDTIVGGECVSLATGTGRAASDVTSAGPFSAGTTQLNFALGEFSRGTLCGLADDGTNGYGTHFGSIIGGTAGQGVSVQLNTGYATAGSVVTVGPASHVASGKVTVWHAPGLYAVNSEPLAAVGDVPAALLVSGQPFGGTVDAETGAVTTAGDCVIDSATAVNAPIFAASNGKLYTPDTMPAAATNAFMVGGQADGARSDQLAIFVGQMNDSSVVSTPASLAQGTWAGSSTVDTDGLGSAYASTTEEYAIYFLGNQGLV
jgi:hypothetical protein